MPTSPPPTRPAPPETPWTGGQYSLVRLVTGLLLIPTLIHQTFYEPRSLAFLPLFLLVLVVPFLLGYRTAIVAPLLALGWLPLSLLHASAYPQHVFGAWPFLLLQIALIAHAMLAAPRNPPPYGSIDACGRTDPAGGWRYQPTLFHVLWIMLALFYLFVSITLLRDEPWRLGHALFNMPGATPAAGAVASLPLPLERALTWLLIGGWLAFPLLALVPHTRAFGWTFALAANLIILPLAGHWPLALALATLHLLTFNPRWLPRPHLTTPETVFFDGECGLCHRTIRFILAEDRDGELFAFAPLGSDFFHHTISPPRREALPNTVIVHRADDVLLPRSTAVIHILHRLGGAWRIVASLLRLIPRPVRDAAYRLVAAIRHRLFAAPSAACPLMPPELRRRFR